MTGQATVRATPTDRNPTHHFSLADGTSTVGFNVVDAKGNKNIKILAEQAYPKSTLAVGSASGQLSERQAPFGEFSRSEWIGGIGQEDDSDATRYYFGERVWTNSPGKVLLAPMVNLDVSDLYESGYRLISNMPRDAGDAAPVVKFSWATFGDTVTHIAVKFTPTVDATVVGILLYNYGTLSDSIPVNVARLFNDDGGGGASVPTTQITTTTTVERGKLMNWEHVSLNASNVALTAGTPYWVVIDVTGYIGNATYGQSTTRRYRGRANNYLVTKQTVDGGTNWTTLAMDPPLFALLTNENFETMQFTDYKRALYCGQRFGPNSQYAENTPVWWVNGDRGAADVNSATMTKLIDATKTWPTTYGKFSPTAIARIVGGPGKGEWRTITNNDATSVTVAAWATAHTTATEYVIYDPPSWLKRTTTGLTTFKNVAVSDQGVLYFPQGQGVNIRRAREYNNAGTWTIEYADDGTNDADLMISGYNASGVNVLVAGNNGDAKSLQRAPAAAWGTNLTLDTETKIGGIEEDLAGLADWEESWAATLTGSIWLVNKSTGVPDKLSADLQLRAEQNGVNPAVMSPYLVFPYGNGIERLFNNIMEDFGPETIDGLPDGYGGSVTDSLPIPGGLLIGKDTGLDAATANYYSGVYMYRSGGWHPIASLPYGHQVVGLGIERAEDRRDMLFIGTRRGISTMQWPREFDYRRDNAHTWIINWEGYLISSWYNAGNEVLQKWWKDITLHVRDVSATESIRVYYQTEADFASQPAELNTAWHYAGVTTSGGGYVQTVTLGVTSRRIRFKFILQGSGYATPELNGYNVQYLARVEASDAYPVMVKLDDAGVDLVGNEERLPAATANSLLKTWRGRIAPLTMRCIESPFDNQSVIIERNSVKVFYLDLPQGKGGLFATFTIIVV